MTNDQMQQSNEDRHGLAEQALIKRLREGGWLVDIEEKECYADSPCENCKCGKE